MAKRKTVEEQMFRIMDARGNYSALVVEEDGDDIWIRQGDGAEVANILIPKAMAWWRLGEVLQHLESDTND